MITFVITTQLEIGFNVMQRFLLRQDSYRLFHLNHDSKETKKLIVGIVAKTLTIF